MKHMTCYKFCLVLLDESFEKLFVFEFFNSREWMFIYKCFKNLSKRCFLLILLIILKLISFENNKSSLPEDV